jgi:hypothetical protein
MSPAPLDGVTTVWQREVELRGKVRSETASEPSQACREFRPARPHSNPEGFGCYCATQHAAAASGGTTPPKGLRSNGSGAYKDDVAAGSERAWQSAKTSFLGRSCKTGSPNCDTKAT